MFENVPTVFKALFVVGVLLTGPAVLFSALLGGATAGAVAAGLMMLFFMGVYMVGFRRAMEAASKARQDKGEARDNTPDGKR
jgi:predicted phage tail protein